MTTNSGTYSPQCGTAWQETFDTNGLYSSTTPEYLCYSTGGWSRESTKTPGYRDIVKNRRGSLPMNPFLFQREKSTFPSGDIYTISTNHLNGYVQTKINHGVQAIGIIPPPSGLDDESLIDSIVSARLLNDLKDQTVNLAVAVGEGKQTLDLFLNTARRFTGAAKALRNGNFVGAATSLGVPLKGRYKKSGSPSAISSNWLELQYGWLPLMSDLYGSAEFLAKQANPVSRTRMSKSHTKVENWNRVIKNGLETIVDSWSVSHTIKYVVWFSEPLGGTPTTALGLSNPLAVAWELVPYSFVADWFIPVGTYLSNIDATNGLSFLRGCRTQFVRGRSMRTESGGRVSDVNTTLEVQKHLVRTFETILCRRTVLTGFPSNKVPHFKNPFSMVHAANALALLRQAFR